MEGDLELLHARPDGRSRPSPCIMATPNTTEHAVEGRIPGVRLLEDALPAPLFARLLEAVRGTGDERLEKNYTTTFWFDLGHEPQNLAEECIAHLIRLANPGPTCAGIEWWLGRVPAGERLRMHFDRDMTLRKRTGRFVHPLRGSVLYLNAFEGHPTVLFDQIPGADGETRVPAKPKLKQSVDCVPNRYVVFPGNLRHGVRPAKDFDASTRPAGADPLRLTFLVNYWDRRPLPPLARDYDGSIYPALRG